MQLSERALKDQLITLSEDKFQLPEETEPFPRALEMMPHLGSVDSELRDDLIYSCLATWILDEREIFAEDELKELLIICLDEEHIFYKLGEKETDSVFKRSFSMLMLPLLLIALRASARTRSPLMLPLVAITSIWPASPVSPCAPRASE